MPDKQDANLVGFFKTRETTLGVLPASPTWQTREPNSFDDFGGEYSKTARRPFSPSRQRRKGTVVDLDADGGYNEDLTQNNMQSELEEFFFAARRKSGELIPTSVVAGVTPHYAIAGAAAAGFKAGSLLIASGYTNAANNGLKIATVVDAAGVQAAGLVAEATATGRIKIVGHQFGAGVIDMTAPAGNTFTLTGVALDTFGLIPGQWLFIGGGAAADSFDSATAGVQLTGYARIALNGVTAGAITFDKSTFTPVLINDAAKTIRIFFGDVIKNEDNPDLIKRFSATVERTLGRDDNGIQSEHLIGAVANELTWNSPLSAFVNLDLSYVGQKSMTRNGTIGPLSRRAGNVIAKALGEDPFNTSSNIFRLRLAAIDPLTLNPTPAFARVTEWSLTINNNVSSAKAQGVLGGFDTIAGGFDVDGEFTAYFSSVAAIHAVRCNHDMTFDAIYAKQNAGIYIDLPLIGLGGGRLDVEMDSAIMLPVETAAAESAFGHTALIGWFPYLPNAAMPDVDC